MLQIKYAGRELLGRYRLTFFAMVMAAGTVAMAALTVAMSGALTTASGRALNPLGKLGADMVVTLPPPSQTWLEAHSIEKGITEDAIKSGYAKSNGDTGTVVIFSSETASDTISINEGMGLGVLNLGVFEGAFERDLKANKAVREVKAISLLSHGYEKQTTAKIITEETSIQPVQVSETEMTEMEKKAEADPIYQNYQAEAEKISAKPEPEYTDMDWQRLEELAELSGNRKMQIYNELRPDAYPAAVIEKKKVKPPEPKVEQRSETVGAIEPDKKSGLLTAGDITAGRFFSGSDEEAAILRQDFAAKRGLKVGDTWSVFDKEVLIVGLAWPGLRQNVPDIFVTSGWLEKTYDVKSVNLLLVKAKRAKDILAIKKFIETEAPGAIITSDRSISQKISGSVLETKRLVYGYGVLINVLVVFVCVVVLVLINFYRFSRRRRDMAVLMALGWSKTRLFFQSILESFLLGLGGFFLAGGATIYGVRFINQRIDRLTVSMPRWEQINGLKDGLGFYTQNSDSFNRNAVVDTLSLQLHVDYFALLSIGAAAMAVMVLVGALSAVRMFTVRPSDALREP